MDESNETEMEMEKEEELSKILQEFQEISNQTSEERSKEVMENKEKEEEKEENKGKEHEDALSTSLTSTVLEWNPPEIATFAIDATNAPEAVREHVEGLQRALNAKILEFHANQPVCR
jgi:uncharacterized protein YbcC (UPF0753/DUF2309 family)